MNIDRQALDEGVRKNVPLVARVAIAIEREVVEKGCAEISYPCRPELRYLIGRGHQWQSSINLLCRVNEVVSSPYQPRDFWIDRVDSHN